jgi:uncharacterized protein YndB with AHSA1/START domain
MHPLYAVATALLFFAEPSPVKVEKLSTPEKALRFEVVIPAPLDDVWAAFTTKAGLQTWLWSDCTVDLRPGGDWIVNYPGGGTIVSFDPRREVVIRAMAPEKFPEVRRQRTTATFRFESAGKDTRVTLLQTGWKDGKEWDEAYDYLAQGNAQLLGQLRYRFVKGPIDWTALKK